MTGEASGARPSAEEARQRSITTYWDKRKDAIYLFVARQVCKKFAKEPKSVIDIGSCATPTLEWHRAPGVKLVSLDLHTPYETEGVESIQQDFLSWHPESRFDLVTCFQTLEHVPAAGEFAQKLLTTGRTIVVSVPYKWPHGKCRSHVHDPVDEQKMLAWFCRSPKFSYLARELNGVERLIQVYGGGPSGTKTRGKPKPSPGRPRNPLRKALRRARKFLASAIGR